MKTGIVAAEILLPNVKDYQSWACIACDQFTSEQYYWDELKSFVADSPSCLNITLPEIYLGEGMDKRIEKINQTILDYINAGVFNQRTEKAVARHELSGGIADFCAAASKKLKFGGNFYCVFRPERLTDLLDAMRQNDIEPKMMTMVYPSSALPPCLVLVRGKRGGKPSLVCTKPLFLYADNTHKESSDAYKHILATGSFPADFFI